MNPRNIFFLVSAIITLLLAACSSGSGGVASVAQVSSPTSTASAVPTPTGEPTATPEPPVPTAAAVLPAPTAAAALPSLDLGGLQNIDMAGMMQAVMGSPELMGCLMSSMGFASVMSLVGRQPTSDEIAQILPCFSDEQLASVLGGSAGVTNSPDPAAAAAAGSGAAKTPVVLAQTALVRPEGVPWYDGPLFDSHTHMTGVTVSFYKGTYTTSDVLRMMDRHNIEGGVAFWLPPVFGGQSEIDLLKTSIDKLDHRLVTLMLPPPFDVGFSFGFMGFAEGTYTRDLLDPWFPPNGPFDGFGEIAFYIDKLQDIGPLDSQLDDVYSLMAEFGGVVMSHTNEFQKAEDWAEVMRRYPEITFLFHGIRDFHGEENDRAPIIELLDTYEGDNFFYSIDAGPLMHAPELEDGGGIGMDSENGEVLTALVDGYGRQRLAEHVYSEFSKEVIDHPDRLLFGTDFLSAWHFEDAGSDVIIDFARRFIGLLPEELQEDFAYKNGQKAFGKYLN